MQLHIHDVIIRLQSFVWRKITKHAATRVITETRDANTKGRIATLSIAHNFDGAHDGCTVVDNETRIHYGIVGKTPFLALGDVYLREMILE